MTYLKKEFGHNLRLIRKSKNLTQEQLAEMINLNQRQLTRIENGISFVSSNVLERLIIALNIDIKELFDFKIKEILLKKVGTDDISDYQVIKENNVIYLQKMLDCSKTQSKQQITKETPDKYLSNLAKKLNKTITAEYVNNGKCTHKYIYSPDGEIKLFSQETVQNSIGESELLFKRIKKLANDEQKLKYINLAIDSLTNSQSRLKLKNLIEGMELISK